MKGNNRLVRSRQTLFPGSVWEHTVHEALPRRIAEKFPFFKNSLEAGPGKMLTK
jgi:hypothetical protein